MKSPRYFLITCLLFAPPLSLIGQPPSVTIQRDVVYGQAGGVDLRMDIGYPDGPGPFPVIVCMHGGGWQQGDKSHMHKWLRKFASAGFVGVSVGYRFAPQFKWPAQIQDVKTAVQYLRAHAGELNIDPTRIGAMGESAGGYLALMLGVTSPDDGLEPQNEYTNPSNVQAVVSFVSATDFTLPGLPLTPALEAEMQQYYKKSLKEVRTDFTGASGPDDPILKKISVLSYVDKTDPPVLMFYGDIDPIVSIEHAYRLELALKKAGVPNELIIVKGGGHGWSGNLQEETTIRMLAFFEGILKNKPR